MNGAAIITQSDLAVFAFFGAALLAAQLWQRWLVRRDADRRTVALLRQIDRAMLALALHDEIQAAVRRGDWLLWLDKIAHKRYPLPKERAKP
jgi:hypothetical protein